MAIPVDVRGLRCSLSREHEQLFMSEYSTLEKVYGGYRNGQFEEVITEELVGYYDGDQIVVGLGGLMWLSKKSVARFKFSSFSPARVALNCPPNIPTAIIESPKWRVRGKDRFYFHEALQACLQNIVGTVKLPTGSGKTEIELTLANTLDKKVGTGVILVPTHLIKSQFLKRARRYNLDNVVDYEDYRGQEIPENVTLVSTPTMLLNDIMSTPNESIYWVIGDEIHHAGCETWTQILMNLPNATRSYGFSALPVDPAAYHARGFRQISYDDARTISAVGPIIYQKSAIELKDFLNIPDIINLYFKWDPDSLPNQESENSWARLQSWLTSNDKRNQLIADALEVLHEYNYSSILFVPVKAQGIDILGRCKGSACWYGGGEFHVSSDLADLEDIDPQVLESHFGDRIWNLTVTRHAYEGLDFDEPLNASVMQSGKSKLDTRQQTGRIVRPSSQPSLVINIFDNGVAAFPRQSRERADNIIQEYGSTYHNVHSIEELRSKIQSIIKAKSHG